MNTSILQINNVWKFNEIVLELPFVNQYSLVDTRRNYMLSTPEDRPYNIVCY